MAYVAWIIATGIRPRILGETITGCCQAASVGQRTTLYSITDAVRVRDLIEGRRPVLVTMFGVG
ncbi:hypothetical protein BANT918_03329 [Brevibacterium antiquum CNRZ 918]|uniref:Uncharacterized protein n=1 Tax=Brevibacterium antiquum CNRZ 918 TaxID=1255637 RepID=A0A2H1L000_9MICO|nr:hypothetical protein BANT918_03329 [Brevibacterium antiquum CNRZ 918]